MDMADVATDVVRRSPARLTCFNNTKYERFSNFSIAVKNVINLG